MTEGKRINYLDMARGIGILLVVIGHIDYVSGSVRQYITSFHMTLFFVISGMLIWYKQEEQQNGSELLLKKIKGIMLPYAFFSLAYFVIEASRLLIKGMDGWGTVFRQLYQSLCWQGVSVLWFLPALFIGELGFIWIRKNSSHIQTLFCLPSLFMTAYYINVDAQNFFAQYSDRLLLSMLYDIVSMLLRSLFCVGLVGFGYYLGMLLLTRRLPVVVEAIASMAMFMVVAIVVKFNGYVDLRGMNLGNFGLFLLEGAAGALGVVLLCRVLARLPLKPIRYAFEYLGRNSLLIFATHIEFRIMYIGIKVATVINTSINNNVIFCIMIALVVFIIEILIIEFVNRFLPYIVKRIVKNS